MNTTDITNSVTQLTNQTNRVAFETAQKNLGKTTLDKNAFLQLLTAQLKSQDPLDPVNDKEFIQQQAALTQIEKMDELTSSIAQSNSIVQASNLVGKTVDVKDSNGLITSGKIDSAAFGTDGIGLTVNGKTFVPNQIVKIYS